MSTIDASGTLYIRQNAAVVQYSRNNSTWTTFAFPVIIRNTTPTLATTLTVLFTTDITTTTDTSKFSVGTNYITFDGANKNFNINATITGINAIFNSNGASYITVKNVIFRGTGTFVGPCFGSFGSFGSQCSILNCINYKNGISLFSNNAGSYGGNLFVSGFINYAVLTGTMFGNDMASYGGFVTIENCSNQNTSPIASGGICGTQAGVSGGSVIIRNCFSNCALTNSSSAGIAGASFGINTDAVCSIIDCYSTGNISENCFGICGNNVGWNTASGVGWNPIVNITNCYSLGNISGSNSGGIVGKAVNASSNTPTVNISNCYSYGTYSAGNGIQSGTSYNATNCYASNGTWSDIDANLFLTGTPTSFYSNNPGTTWASIVSDTPYVLSSFNSAIYNPNSATEITSPYIIDPGTYTSEPGLFQPDYSYNLLSIDDSDPSPSTIDANNGEITFANVPYKSSEIAEVFVYQGTAPYYKSYNLNTFAYSNSCFPAKTPIQTDQGIINIDELNSEVHTIRNKKIVAVTKIVSQDKHVVCFEQDSLGKNVPSQKTVISQNHEVFYKGKMMKAKDFVGSVDNVYMKKYTGEVLYNVLMEEHDKMIVNNLVCETLDPKNRIAKLYMMLQKMTPERQETFIKKFNEAQENEEEIKRNKCVSISKK